MDSFCFRIILFSVVAVRSSFTREATSLPAPSVQFPTIPDWIPLMGLRPSARIDYTVLPAIRIRTAIVLAVGTSTDYDFNLLQPAISAAFAVANATYNVQFDATNYLYEVAEVNSASPDAQLGRTQGCWMWNASGAAANAVNESVQLVIGPACIDDLSAVNELLEFFRIPCITGAPSLKDGRDSAFNYLTRFGFNIRDMWSFLRQMFNKYSWSDVVLFYDTDDPKLNAYGTSFIGDLKQNGFSVYDIQINGTEFENFTSIDLALNEGRGHGRVFVFLLRGLLTRYFLTFAARRNMANGDFVFFTADLFRDDLLSSPAAWKRRDGYDRDAFKAFQHLFVLTLRESRDSVAYRQFQTQIRQEQRVAGSKLSINYYSITFYDAILMFAMRLREYFGDTQPSRITVDPKNLIRQLWNRSFAGASGNVFISPQGMRVNDFSIIHLNNATEETLSTPVAHFIGRTGRYEEVEPIEWHSANGQPPENSPKCGFIALVCEETNSSVSTTAAIIAAVLAVLLIAAVFAGVRYVRKRTQMQHEWVAEWDDLNLDSSVGASRSSMSSTGSSKATLSHGSQSSVQKTIGGKRNMSSGGRIAFATWHGKPVMVIRCENNRLTFNSKVTDEVRTVMTMNHDNLLPFLGAAIGHDRLAVIGEYCSKASLQDLLSDETVKLDWIFRYSLLSDIVKGLSYIHTSPLGCHGRLSSGCCYVDSKFVVKIGSYGLPSFYNHPPSIALDQQYYRSLFWTAPELLDEPNRGTQEGDVYSYGIILQEIIMREEPYSTYSLEPEEIIDRVRNPTTELFRPAVHNPECPLGLLALVDQCWQHDPQERARLAQVRTAIRQTTKGAVEKSNIVDLLLSRMEDYAKELEKKVDEKSLAFKEEQKKADKLLSQILPPGISERLRRGEAIPPEHYESASIFFSDIMDFLDLSTESSALEIVNFLNDLYTMFDSAVNNFDVYKVETIRDSYMVASGLPKRNGLNHAPELAKLSFHLMDLIRKFKVRHRPNLVPRLRIGLNTGPVVSGVVGLAVPRFCLFGDTVNTASRMQTSSEGLKIQISPSTKYILDGFGGFVMEERGEVELKGKGLMKTYWLVSENEPVVY